ncbi:MAG: TetR/AcrR family transcriptional regulator [Nannocystales bacterium]
MRLPAKAGLHDEIVRVSIQLGSELGEDGLTMRAIAARLGVSATALYQHFESKAAILREIRLHGVDTLLSAMAASAELGNAEARIREIARRYTDFALSNPWLYKVLFQGDEVDWASLEEDERDLLMAPLRQTREAFEIGVRAGAFRHDVDVDNTALLFWASLHGLASLMINGRVSEGHPVFPVPDRDDFVGNFISGLVRAVRAS